MVAADKYANVSQLIVEFWRALDDGDHDRLLSLLTPDARWNRGGKWREGHDDIRLALKERPPELFVRHVVTNVSAADIAQGVDLRHLLIAYSRRRVAGDAPPFPSGAPALIVDYRAACVATAEGWRLTSLSGVQAFSAHAKV